MQWQRQEKNIYLVYIDNHNNHDNDNDDNNNIDNDNDNDHDNDNDNDNDDDDDNDNDNNNNKSKRASWLMSRSLFKRMGSMNAQQIVMRFWVPRYVSSTEQDLSMNWDTSL